EIFEGIRDLKDLAAKIYARSVRIRGKKQMQVPRLRCATLGMTFVEAGPSAWRARDDNSNEKSASSAFIRGEDRRKDFGPQLASFNRPRFPAAGVHQGLDQCPQQWQPHDEATEGPAEMNVLEC